MIGTNFHHYSVAYGVISARFRTFIIRLRLTTPLSQAPLLGQDELTRRKRDLDTRGHKRSAPHLILIGFRPATRLMISSCRVVTALALITRVPPYTALLSGWSSHLVLIRFRLTFPYRKQGLPGRDELGFHTLSVKHTLDCTPCNHEDIGLVNGFIGLGLDFD